MPRKKKYQIIEFDVYKIELKDGHLRVQRPETTAVAPGEDYGCDPLGDGTFKMVPSGDIVNYEERCKRLSRRRPPPS